MYLKTKSFEYQDTKKSGDSKKDTTTLNNYPNFSFPKHRLVFKTDQAVLQMSTRNKKTKRSSEEIIEDEINKFQELCDELPELEEEKLFKFEELKRRYISSKRNLAAVSN